MTVAPIMKQHRMNSHCREPRLEEMLADPIVKAVMEADGADLRELARIAANRSAIARDAAHSVSTGTRPVRSSRKERDHMRYRIVVWSAIGWIAVCLAPYLYALNDLITWR